MHMHVHVACTSQRLAKQLREAFRVNSHLNTWNYRFAVGTAVRHTKHGVGKVRYAG